MDPVKKALRCQKAEHDHVGTHYGIMDEFAVTFAKRGYFLLTNCATLEREPVTLPGDEAAILDMNTMVRQALNDASYKERRADCEAAARRLGVPTPGAVAPAGNSRHRPSSGV